jgi:hypothetical protein
MVLLASELVEVYIKRIVTFLGNLCGFVKAIGPGSKRARIWERDRVRYGAVVQSKEKERIVFMLDHGVAEGKMMRK